MLKNSTKIVAVLIALSFCISLFIRIYFPFRQVFTDLGIKFTCNDAYYHMRLVDNLVHNFPRLTYFDPYYIYPTGTVVGGVRFFDWLLASIIWVIGFGSPTQHTVDVVGVYFPAVLAALAIVPVYFIGKTLFNKWVGVISAMLIAVLPGEFLGRSILGSTDHHVAEVLFSAVFIAFLVLAVRRDGKLSIAYSLLAGVSLGIYLFTWIGGLLFAFIVILYFVAQIVINHIQHKSSVRLGIGGSITFVVALVMNLSKVFPKDALLAMIIASLIPIVLSGMSWLMLRWKFKVGYYPLSLLMLGSASLGILYLAIPNIVTLMLANFAVFNRVGGTATTTLELQPILYPGGMFTTSVAWGNFSAGLYLAPIGLGILIFTFVKHKFQEQGWLLFIIWTLVMTILTLMQRRYAYYLAVNVALLVGFLSYLAIELVNPKFEKGKKKQKNQAHYIGMTLMIVVVFVVAILPNVFMAKTQAMNTPFSPSDDWQLSLLWMENNTPEPFQGSDIYDNYYRLDPDDVYPKPDYGVTAWWDYGYWISRVAHRVPIANPAQNPAPIKQVANLFLSQDGMSTEDIMDVLGSRYVVVDYGIATGKFYALATWAEQPQGKYYEIYYVTDESQLKQVIVFYPSYYRTLLVRLYNFGGKAVTDIKPFVITYSNEVDSAGLPYKYITSGREFSDYQAAVDYVGLHPLNKFIAGTNPFVSPIPLDALSDYQLVYTSPQQEVKIFEYTRIENSN